MPSSGSDFVTAPELSPMFGRALAAQVADALRATGTQRGVGVWRGVGRAGGAAAGALGSGCGRYTIVDLSGSLRARQQQALASHGAACAMDSQRAARADERRGGGQRGAGRHAGQAAGAGCGRVA
jgi:SAM-dependent MidA family methyltransferase